MVNVVYGGLDGGLREIIDAMNHRSRRLSHSQARSRAPPSSSVWYYLVPPSTSSRGDDALRWTDKHTLCLSLRGRGTDRRSHSVFPRGGCFVPRGGREDMDGRQAASRYIIE
jgi:hypothetical protein